MELNITQESIKTRSELKKYFEKGDYPTETQFAQLIDSFAHLTEFIELKNAVKKLEENSQFRNYPIIKVYQPYGSPTWSSVILYANQAAHLAGLVAGDMFWMETGDIPNTPLVLMRAKDFIIPANGSGFNGLSGSGSSGGIGGGLIQAWANAKSFNTSSSNQFFCGGNFKNLKLLSYNGTTYLKFDYNDITFPNNSAVSVQLFNAANQVITSSTLVITSGSATYQFGNYATQSQVVKIVINASTYSTSSNSMCTNGQIIFTP